MNLDAHGWSLMRPRPPGYWPQCDEGCGRAGQWERLVAQPDWLELEHLCDEHHAADLLA